MEDAITINRLLDLAIYAERNSEDLYDRFEEMFIDCPEVARFWSRYSNEEAGHARWIENLRKRAPTEKLSAPADPEIWAQAARVTSISAEQMVENIHDLQDAWDLANEIEHGETNVVFEFLIDSFAGEEQVVAFLRTQLHEHLSHLLIDFPSRYREVSARRMVRAKK